MIGYPTTQESLPQWFTIVLGDGGLVGFVAIIIAAVAAFMSWRAAKDSLRTNETQLLLDFWREYDNPEMAKSLKNLATVWKRAETPREWASQRNSISANWQNDADLARRSVKMYFARATRLHIAGELSDDIYGLILARAGIEIYVRLCQVMEAALSEHREDRDYNHVRAFIQRHPDVFEFLKFGPESLASWDWETSAKKVTEPFKDWEYIAKS